jgi:heparan sulfate N-deacetylase/N-sulfotransferase NDST2
MCCVCLKDAALNAASPVLRLTRAGETAWGGLPGDDWTIFSPNHSTYEPLAWATRNSADFMSEEISRTPLPTVLQVCVVCLGISLLFFMCCVSETSLHVCCVSETSLLVCCHWRD